MSRFATEVLPVLLLVLFVMGQAGVAALLIAIRREVAETRSYIVEVDQRLTELLRPKIEP